MRRSLSLILVLLFTLYVQSAPVAWILYALDADAIAAAYCVNPDKPSCHGKCHIIRTTSGEKSPTSPASEITLPDLPPFLGGTFRLSDAVAMNAMFSSATAAGTLQGYHPPIYHPPTILC